MSNIVKRNPAIGHTHRQFGVNYINWKYSDANKNVVKTKTEKLQLIILLAKLFFHSTFLVSSVKQILHFVAKHSYN